MAFRPWKLEEAPYSSVKDAGFQVAILPLGATEPHNLHLPYGTDTFQVDVLADRACELAFRQGVPVVRLPSIPFGTETNLQKFPLAINLNPSTLGAMIRDVCQSLQHAGIRKFVLLNGHGGNDFKPLLRELYGQTPVHLFLCDWFRGLTADVQRQIFDVPGDHAGEMETSLGLAFFPDLVQINPDSRQLDADDGTMKSTRLEGVNKGWVSITRPWHLLTTNTGAGNPHAATAEKGERLMTIMVDRLAAFLVELAQEPLTEKFPY